VNRFAIAIVCVPLHAFAAEPEAGKVVDLVFKKVDGKDLSYSVHFPADWKPTDKRPCVVFFFGGGWVKGTPKQFEPQATHLAARGLVAVRADYRLGKGPAVCVADARSAVRRLRADAGKLGIDPDRIASAGGSAGGHLAACVGTTDGFGASGEDAGAAARSNAMLLFNPVLDLEPLIDRLPADQKILAGALSPVQHVVKDSPPTIIFFGTADGLLKQGKAYLEAGRKKGAKVELYTAADQPHGFFNRSPWRESTLRAADDFLVSLGWLKPAADPLKSDPGALIRAE